MRAGNLRDPIKIHAISKTVNFLGEPVKSNVLLKSTRADVQWDNGDEKEQNSQLTPVQTVTFNIRFDLSIDETMLVEFRGAMYDIRFISHILREKTILKTTKRKPNGNSGS